MNFLKISIPELGKQRNADYMNARPFPNTYFDSLSDVDMVNQVIAEFPRPAIHRPIPAEGKKKFSEKQ